MRTNYLLLFFSLPTFFICASCDNDEAELVEQVEIPQLSCPDNNHPHMIDLVPSGTKWACCNIDATAPEQYGGFYAWGEMEPKSVYDWTTYTLCNGSSETCHFIGDSIPGTEYDIAHVKWGDSWQMPTFMQLKELKESCTWLWSDYNGVNGYFVTGYNKATIFLPAAGGFWVDRHSYEGEYGFYWSSSVSLDDQSIAYDLRFGSLNQWGFGLNRYEGHSVRAVVSQ